MKYNLNDFANAAVDKVEMLDLSACAREPIHSPGGIQPYGILLKADAQSGIVEQAAADPVSAVEVGSLLGRPLADVLPTVPVRLVLAAGEPSYFGIVRGLGVGAYHVVAHRSDESTIVELERVLEDEPGSFEDLYPLVRSFLASLETVPDVTAVCTLAAAEVRRITDFDRVLIYQFDDDWNGTVIAEDRNEELPSYLDLRFPASDIPAQARELYRRNRLRLIADANYAPVPLEPRSGEAVDLSLAMLRSVSPVHLQYMRNMGTSASMSISLLRGGELWGLISCHNRRPRRVPYHVRTACDFLGQILSLQISAKEQASAAESRIARRGVHTALLAAMAGEGSFLDGLARDPEQFLRLADAQGAAIVFGGECRRLGDAPPEAAILAIADWLAATRTRDDAFATEQLGEVMPGAGQWAESASGLLAVSISQLHASYLMWFRPEVVRTVKWGGDPRKPVGDPVEHLTPRTSFAAWRETVRHRALPWHSLDRDMALELRMTVVDIVLRLAEEKAELNEQLTRSNNELEAFSYSVSHDLRAPFRHIVGFSELLLQSAGDRLSDRDRRYVATIINSAQSAGILVDSLLHFSQMGRSSLGLAQVDLAELVSEVLQQLKLDVGERPVEWRIGRLPTVRADLLMLRQVFQNLLHNAVKFTQGRSPAIIELRHERVDGEEQFEVRDNGCGFEMAYVDKLFGVFQRLHHADEFEGTGIGLANVRRIIERHGGRTWAEGEIGQGASFYFTLPSSQGD